MKLIGKKEMIRYNTVYGDVFIPFFKNCTEEITYALEYIEILLDMKDICVDEVVAFSILENIFYFVSEKNNLFDFL